jgi:hypothetical protein
MMPTTFWMVMESSASRRFLGMAIPDGEVVDR